MTRFVSRSQGIGDSSKADWDGNNMANVIPSGSPQLDSSAFPETSPELLQIRSEIEKYKDDPYIYSQLMNAYNSYAQQRFSPTLRQQLGEALGDTSARQNFANEQLSGLRDTIARIIEGKHKEEYSSETAQVQRMSQAGVNVDLNGGQGIAPGDPAGIDQTEANAPVVNSGQSDVGSIAQIGTNIVSFAMQMYTGFQNIRSLSLDNAMKELSMSNEMRDIAWNVISEGVTEFLGSNKGKYSKEELLDPSFTALAPSLIESFGSRINSLPLTRRQKRSLSGIIDSLTWSYNGEIKVPTSKYQTLINNMNTDLFKSRNALAQASALPGADSESIDVIRAIGADIYKPLVDMQLKVEKAVNNVKLLQAKFNSDYYTEANKLGLGSQTAGAEFASRKLVAELSEAKNEITASFKAIRDKILSDKKLGENWKMALLTGTSITEVVTMNQLMTASSAGLKLF